MSISFDGIGEVVATFRVSGSVAPGSVVCLTDSGEVGPGSSGGHPCGVALSVSEDGFAGVQIGGLAEVRYSGTAPEAGWSALCADGDGGVKTVSTGGSSYLVVSVDEGAKTAVIKL